MTHTYGISAITRVNSRKTSYTQKQFWRIMNPIIDDLRSHGAQIEIEQGFISYIWFTTNTDGEAIVIRKALAQGLSLVHRNCAYRFETHRRTP